MYLKQSLYFILHFIPFIFFSFHFNLTERMDLTFVSQYMIHLGEDIHAEVEHGVVHYEKHKGAGLEGHLLFHLGINYKIADLW